MKERGIILSITDIQKKSDGGLVFNGVGPNPNLLRHSILYWNKIAFPQGVFFRSTGIPEVEYLKDLGVAQEITIPIHGNQQDFNYLYGLLQTTAFDELNRKEPGMWTIGQSAIEFISNSPNVTREHVFEVELNNVLPTPPENIPFSDILEFKEKRKDEFLALRITVDGIYDDALGWECLPRGENAAINELNLRIKDIRDICDTSWLYRGSSLKLDFTIPKLVKATMEGYLYGKFFSDYLQIPGLELAGACLNPLAQCIKFEKKLGNVLSSNVPERAKNFVALYYVEKEFPGTL